MHINNRAPTRVGSQQGEYLGLNCFPSEMVCHRLSLGFFCVQDIQMCCQLSPGVICACFIHPACAQGEMSGFRSLHIPNSHLSSPSQERPRDGVTP